MYFFISNILLVFAISNILFILSLEKDDDILYRLDKDINFRYIFIACIIIESIVEIVCAWLLRWLMMMKVK